MDSGYRYYVCVKNGERYDEGLIDDIVDLPVYRNPEDASAALAVMEDKWGCHDKLCITIVMHDARYPTAVLKGFVTPAGVASPLDKVYREESHG